MRDDAVVAISVDIPGRGELVLEHVVLDLNGTLTSHGRLIDGVGERLARLGEKVDVQLLSADTFGVLAGVSTELQAQSRTVTTGDEKARCVWELGPERCAAIGNGANDAPMLEIVALGVVVVGPEGAAAAAVRSADVLCGSILEALDLLLDERALVATLRL